MACDNDGKADVSRTDHCKINPIPRNPKFRVNVFDFTGISLLPVNVCKECYSKGQSANPCLIKRQAGFEIHEDICMSMIASRSCYPPKQNRHNLDFLIANLFRSAIVIHYKATGLKEPLLDISNHANRETTTPCTHLPTLYQRLLPQQGLTDSIQCALLYFDSIVFATFAVDLSIRDLTTKLFPGVEVFHTMLLNHDPLAGVSCSGGIRHVHLTHLHVLNDQNVQWRSRESKHIFRSNKDPTVMIQKQFAMEFEVLAFICKPMLENENCRTNIVREGSSQMDSCVKYELTDNNTTRRRVADCFLTRVKF